MCGGEYSPPPPFLPLPPSLSTTPPPELPPSLPPKASSHGDNAQSRPLLNNRKESLFYLRRVGRVLCQLVHVHPTKKSVGNVTLMAGVA